jgi:hypothetical protein
LLSRLHCSRVSLTQSFHSLGRGSSQPSPRVKRGKHVAEAIEARVFDPDTADTGAEGDVFSPNPAMDVSAQPASPADATATRH